MKVNRAKLIAEYCRAHDYPEPELEFRFEPKRRWRFDLAWPTACVADGPTDATEIDLKIAIEIEGGVWIRGAHTRGKHFESDARKYNAAGLLGWRVFRFTPEMIDKGEVYEMLDQLFSNNPE